VSKLQFVPRVAIDARRAMDPASTTNFVNRWEPSIADRCMAAPNAVFSPNEGGYPAMKILVIDDHALIRQAMQGVLKKVRRDAILLEAPNSKEAMQIIAAQPDIDLILLDLTLPDCDGFSVFIELHERYPAIAIVMLSAVQDPANVMKALELGARGYIPKSAQADVILNALRLIISGGTYVPPEILAGGKLSNAAMRQFAGDRAERSPADTGLTDRQLDVLALIMQGKNNKTICRTLELAEPTVKNHVTAILKALKVTSRTEAVIVANNLGWKFSAIVKQ
jgi:DNA-binding NarL/FixJ family response regulator